MPAREHVLRLAPAGPPRATVLIVPPLFEEANRTRRTLVLAMRALAAEGLSALLPDLPGQNERPIPLVEADLTRWRVALARVVAGIGGPVVVASLRGGALIDPDPLDAGWWALPPAG